MIVDTSLFSFTFLLALSLVCLGVVGTACWQAPWKALLDRTERQHALFAAWISLVLMMKLQIHWVEGISLHFLVMTTLVVIFGWSLTMLIGLAAQALLMIWQGDYGFALVANYFLSAVVPGAIAYGVLRWIVRQKSNNLFMFLLGGGFFGSIFTLLCSLLVLCLVLLVNGQWDTLQEVADNGLMVVLLCYSEGFLNGMLVTAVTVFFPSIVKTFDEKKYLDS